MLCCTFPLLNEDELDAHHHHYRTSEDVTNSASCAGEGKLASRESLFGHFDDESGDRMRIWRETHPPTKAMAVGEQATERVKG